MINNSGEKMYCRDLGGGISFRYIKESRFKTGCISVHFIMPLSRERVTANAVLAGLLKRSCEDYPEYTLFRRRLAMLYGAEVSASVSGIGNCQMVTVEISMPDDRFIPDGERVSVGCAELLCGMIFRPAKAADGSIFHSDDIETSIRLANERITSLINNKGEYAKHRCAAIMCENEAYGIESGGYAEDLPKITREVLVEAWQNMLQSAAVNILMVGTADGEAVAEKFRCAFDGVKRDYKQLPPAPDVPEVSAEREVVERMDVQQSKMVIGMRIPVTEPDGNTMAARLMSMLYGGTATSLLFNNVREKLSLCYYCSSNYLRKNGLIFVQSGLEEVNYRKAVDEIKKQLAVVAENKFKDEDLAATKLYAVNAFAEINDSVYSIERWYAMQFMDGCVLTPEEAAEKISAVTRDEVAECAAKAWVDTVYLLAPEKAEGSEGSEK